MAPKKKIVIVASQYNERYTDGLVDNCIDELSELSPLSKIDLVRVQGAFEIPVAISAMIDRGGCDCVIALGVILKGDTAHADLVASAVTDSLMKMSVDTQIPIIHEVLLLNDEKQAYSRCIGEELNRGIEAARSALAILQVFAELKRPSSK